MAEQDIVIHVNDLVMNYGSGSQDIQVLRGLDFDILRGDMVAITGPSGCGKSTLLFILGLFLLPSKGSYLFSGEDVLSLSRPDQAKFRRKKVGFVFQSADLLEKSTVYENLEFPLMYAGVRRRDRNERIFEALDLVNLGNRIRHPANLLSGGERQRVAVARALVNRPQVILADEPTGQLDQDNTQFIMDYFEKIVREVHATVIIVTHDPSVARRCERIFRLENGKLKE
jgi:putative ABC transport system ATP-binding protein